MSHARAGFLLIVGFFVFFSGCGRDEPVASTNADRLRALLPAQPAFLCHNLTAFIPKGQSVEGPNCMDNKAVVNGWSERCVAEGQCNTPGRLAELNTAAEAFCAGWCNAKSCGYQYTAHSACDSAWCNKSTDCQKNCDVPLLDTCYFQQAAPGYTCHCHEKIER